MKLSHALAAAGALALASCDAVNVEGMYGASSGPNSNDPDAGPAAEDPNPMYDDPELAIASELKTRPPPTQPSEAPTNGADAAQPNEAQS